MYRVRKRYNESVSVVLDASRFLVSIVPPAKARLSVTAFGKGAQHPTFVTRSPYRYPQGQI